MANFISTATGNFSAAASWGTCDGPSAQTSRFTTYPTTPTGSNSQTTNSNTTTTTTSNVFTAAFTPTNGGTGDGLLLYVGRNAVGSTGTFTCGLSTDGISFLAGQQVTVNVSDIPFCGTSSTSSAVAPLGTWMFFKFPSTVAFNGSQAYRLGVVSSVSGSVNVFRGSATATDFERLLRLTATGAPGANDVTFIVGDWTAQATSVARTITMDVTTGTATTFGKMDIGSQGTLAYGTTASTNYRLKMGSYLDVWSGGTLTMGTSGTPVPSTSTALLEFESAGQTPGTNMFGLDVNNGGTFTTFGNAITQSALLAADAGAAATSLTTNVSTGWLINDSIGIASTTTTAGNSEKKTLTANAATTTLTIAALTNAHSGTAPTQGELINLTRNVKVSGLTAGTPGFVFCDPGATASCSNTEFTLLGSSSTPTAGITLRTNPAATPAGTSSFTGCSVHDAGTSAYGFYLEGLTSAPIDSITISNCNLYLTNNTGINVSSLAASPPGNNINISGCIGVQCTTAMLSTTSGKINVSNCTAAGNPSNGFVYADNTTGGGVAFGTFTGNTAHSNGSTGMAITTTSQNVNWSSMTIWRNSTGFSSGVSLSPYGLADSIFSTMTVFGNGSTGISLGSVQQNVTFQGLIVDAGVTLTQPSGLTFANTYDAFNCLFLNSTFGANQTHATADWVFSTSNSYYNLFCNNLTLASPTQMSGFVAANVLETSKIGVTRLQQTAGNHKMFMVYGVITSDNVLFKTAAPSEKLTPTNVPTTGRLRLESAPKRCGINNGSNTVVSAWVRQSVVGDGAAYNGAFPRLMLKANPGAGILTDTVIATGTVAGQGTFELLSGATPAVSDDAVLEFVVDCNGTAGFVNVDDWAVT